MERSDAFVSLHGGIGTLCDVTLAWSLMQTRSFTKPLVLVGAQWHTVIEAFRAETDMTNSIASLAQVVARPADVVDVLDQPMTPRASDPLPMA